MSENGEIHTTGKKLTLPLAVTAWTNITSVQLVLLIRLNLVVFFHIHNFHFSTHSGETQIFGSFLL